MTSWTGPRSFRLARAVDAVAPPDLMAMQSISSPTVIGHDPGGIATMVASHPDFAHLVLLVFEAVLEVVCVSLPGFIIARMGMFNAEQQKFLANLNVQL